MPEYDVMRELLGKTMTGVLVKENVSHGQPAMAVHLFFDDGTSYEIYAMYDMDFAGGLNRWRMEEARKYLTPPMKNVLDVSLDQG